MILPGWKHLLRFEKQNDVSLYSCTLLSVEDLICAVFDILHNFRDPFSSVCSVTFFFSCATRQALLMHQSSKPTVRRYLSFPTHFGPSILTPQISRCLLSAVLLLPSGLLVFSPLPGATPRRQDRSGRPCQQDICAVGQHATDIIIRQQYPTLVALRDVSRDCCACGATRQSLDLRLPISNRQLVAD